MSANRLVVNDTLRRVLVTAALVACLIGTAFGVGLIGTRVAESSGGALSATATLIAPATNAFSIWSVIYAGLIAYTIWQWLPSVRTDERARATGLLAATSMVLNAAWLGVTQVDWLWASVGVIVVLLIVLVMQALRITGSRPRSWFEAAAVDVTFGLYLGWVAVATCANITATLVASGVSFGAADTWLAVVVLIVAAAVGVLLAWRLGGRYAVAVALAWGLFWIGIARTVTEPRSAAVGVAAFLAAVVVLGAAVVARTRHGVQTR